jgi:chemotaxis signal transduction protein
MSSGDVTELVARLRASFDEGFTRPDDTIREFPAAYVLARVGQTVHAIATDGLKTVAKCTTIVGVPSRAPGLVGIAASRGAIMGVYALADLLGLSSRQPTASEWILVCSDGQTGLVVDAVVGYARAAPASLRIDAEARSHALIRALLEVEGGSYPVIDLSCVMARIGAAPRHGETED